MASWFVIGISGVSCAGKTSLSKNLRDFLMNGQFSDPKWNGDPRVEELRRRFANNTRFRIGNVELRHQDDYFQAEQFQEDVDVLGLPRKNWELITALDMKRMCSDIENILVRDGKVTLIGPNLINILILEGFTIFANPFIMELSNLKLHLHLPFEHCYERRKRRVYDPPDDVGYFEICVWPEYEKYFRDRIKERKDIRLLNGELPKIALYTYALNCIGNALKF